MIGVLTAMYDAIVDDAGDLQAAAVATTTVRLEAAANLDAWMADALEQATAGGAVEWTAEVHARWSAVRAAAELEIAAHRAYEARQGQLDALAQAIQHIQAAEDQAAAAARDARLARENRSSARPRPTADELRRWLAGG